MPPVSIPDFSLAAIQELAPKAFPVALIGLFEGLSIARSVAAHSRQMIDGNQEFIGQRLSNICRSFFRAMQDPDLLHVPESIIFPGQ